MVLIILITTIQCTSVPKLQKESPTTFKETYYQKWNAGIKEGGSGINVYLETINASILLDRIYFRGKMAKLQKMPNNSLLYIGRFKSKINDSIEDSKQLSNWPFQIEDDECVVSYSVEKKVLYFKISNLKERQSINYPRLPSNRQ